MHWVHPVTPLAVCDFQHNSSHEIGFLENHVLVKSTWQECMNEVTKYVEIYTYLVYLVPFTCIVPCFVPFFHSLLKQRKLQGILCLELWSLGAPRGGGLSGPSGPSVEVSGIRMAWAHVTRTRRRRYVTYACHCLSQWFTWFGWFVSMYIVCSNVAPVFFYH